MNRKVISFGLSATEINRVLRELEAYKREIQHKTKLMQRRVADRLAELAQSGFSGATVDDLVNGGGRSAEVSVTVDERENVSVVIASGEDAVWVEFGAGVYHNGAAGSSPHPNGASLGLTIGSYGKGHGKQKVWGYYDGDELVLTHGTQATMPMYNAMKTVCGEIDAIAREVWG